MNSKAELPSDSDTAGRNVEPDPAEPTVVHAGHKLESGVLARAREWVDVLPWLRLGRVLRIAASPVSLLLVAAVFVVWKLGLTLITDQPWQTLDLQAVRPPVAIWFQLTMAVSAAINPLTPLLRMDRILIGFLVFAWTLLVWTTPALWLTRQGALLMGKRPMTPLVDGLRYVVRRTPAAWLAAVIPIACVMVFVVPAWLLVALGNLLSGVAGIGAVTGVIAALILLPAGILGFVSFFAIPLSFAAIANERHGDSLDSLSRGYESVLRRPLHGAGYLAVGVVCSCVVGGLAAGCAIVANLVTMACLPVQSPETSLSATLAFFPQCVVFALSWGLLGGIYLLLRRDTGGQEVEDLWLPVPRRGVELPSLPDSVPDSKDLS